MRHGKKFNHLGRTASHRKAMLANMACSLIEHKRINTTTAKAKALKQFVEPIVTRAKQDNNQTTDGTRHNRRVAFSMLRNKHAVTELFSTVAEKIGDRPGGYTRIIKLGNRLGDNADMAMIEFVDFNSIYNAEEKKAKTTRRGRRSKAAAQVEEVTEVTEESVESTEEVAEVETTEAEAPEAAAEEAQENDEESTDDESKTT
ncbi:MAG: 50S ribosomal protein L17 [Flavobacteriaceae bacterium]